MAFTEETTSYSQSLHERWRSGELPKEWRRLYPDIFDDDDLRLATSQPSYHFFEWVGALHYHKTGFSVLVEQYIYAAHPRKISLISQFITENDLQFLRGLPAQPPDLFLYRDAAEFFFAEVKSASDSLSGSQVAAFNGIAARLSTDIRVLRVVPG